jgi:uncharacterized protein (TIGR04222 family)
VRAFSAAIPAGVVVGGYVGLLVVLHLVFALARHRRFRRPGPDAPLPQPYELAYLAGGQDRALQAGLAALRAQGAIDVSADGLLQPTGERAPSTDGVPLALLTELAHEGRPAKLASTPATGRAISTVQAALRRDGWVVDYATPALLRPGVALQLAMFFLAWVLIFYCVATYGASDPAAGTLALLAIGALMSAAALADVPTMAASARAVLGRARRGRGDLARLRAWPAQPRDAALAVALFGPGVFWSVDREFAWRADIPRHRPARSRRGRGADGWDAGYGWPESAGGGYHGHHGHHDGGYHDGGSDHDGGHDHHGGFDGGGYDSGGYDSGGYDGGYDGADYGGSDSGGGWDN